MQNTASVPTDQFPDLLARLPASLDLDRLALETKAIQRKRKIGDGASLLRLALARGPGGFSFALFVLDVDVLISAGFRSSMNTVILPFRPTSTPNANRAKIKALKTKACESGK